MGKRGPRPDKNSRRTALGKNTYANIHKFTPKEKIGKATMPNWLDSVAQEFWRGHAPYCEKLGTLDGLSETLFVILCNTYSMIQRARKIVDSEGEIYITKKGIEKIHPAFKILIQYEKSFSTLNSEFCLTPAGRHRLGLTYEENTNES